MIEHERDQISSRTKVALATAKARGVVLGGAANLKPNIEERQQAPGEFAGKLNGVIERMRASGSSQSAMREELNQLGISTARDGNWLLIQLQRVIAKLT